MKNKLNKNIIAAFLITAAPFLVYLELLFSEIRLEKNESYWNTLVHEYSNIGCPDFFVWVLGNKLSALFIAIGAYLLIKGKVSNFFLVVFGILIYQIITILNINTGYFDTLTDHWYIVLPIEIIAIFLVYKLKETLEKAEQARLRREAILRKKLRKSKKNMETIKTTIEHISTEDLHAITDTLDDVDTIIKVTQQDDDVDFIKMEVPTITNKGYNVINDVIQKLDNVAQIGEEEEEEEDIVFDDIEKPMSAEEVEKIKNKEKKDISRESKGDNSSNTNLDDIL